MASQAALEEVKKSVGEDRQANLQEADLRRANLWQANLQEANLREANLQEANLREANLQEANLRRANLWQANLQEADLRRANLWQANLQEANLWGAIIRTTLNYKRDSGELKALEKLAEHISKENVDRWKTQGKFIEDDAIFMLNELVCTPTGTYCIEVKGDCTPTDRVIHRLMLWRHDREKFYKIGE